LKKADIVHVMGIRTSTGTIFSSKLKDIPAVATVNDPWATCYYSLHFKDGETCDRCTPAKFNECLEKYGGRTAAVPYLKVTMKERLFFLSRFDGLLPLSTAMEEILRLHGVECEMEVVPWIIDSDKFSFKEPPKRTTLGFVGRLDEGKGLDHTIRIAHSTGLPLRIVGEGPAEAGARKLAEELGHGDMIEFVGKVPYEDVPAEYQKMSLLLAPFTRVEALGRVLMEANSCGRGVLTTSICGGAERVTEGFNGFVFEPGDVEGMTAKVRAISEDRGLLAELGVNGRRFVQENHSPEVILKRTEDFYERVIENRRR
jgi:glycosyltransferase involved in cell wall biosynthesis